MIEFLKYKLKSNIALFSLVGKVMVVSLVVAIAISANAQAKKKQNPEHSIIPEFVCTVTVSPDNQLELGVYTKERGDFRTQVLKCEETLNNYIAEFKTAKEYQEAKVRCCKRDEWSGQCKCKMVDQCNLDSSSCG